MASDQVDADVLPCPFCGGKAETIKGYATEQVWQHGEFHRVYCTSCQSRQLFHRTREDAVGAWNKRPDLAARVEAERVACAKAVSVVFDRYHKKSDPISQTMAAGVVMAESSIRALGPTPAFDTAIKAAREDGMEAAAKIAQADERTYQGYDGCNPALIVPRIINAIRAAKDQPA